MPGSPKVFHNACRLSVALGDSWEVFSRAGRERSFEFFGFWEELVLSDGQPTEEQTLECRVLRWSATQRLLLFSRTLYNSNTSAHGLFAGLS